MEDFKNHSSIGLNKGATVNLLVPHLHNQPIYLRYKGGKTIVRDFSGIRPSTK